MRIFCPATLLPSFLMEYWGRAAPGDGPDRQVEPRHPVRTRMSARRCAGVRLLRSTRSGVSPMPRTIQPWPDRRPGCARGERASLVTDASYASVLLCHRSRRAPNIDDLRAGNLTSMPDAAEHFKSRRRPEVSGPPDRGSAARESGCVDRPGLPEW